MVSQRKSGAILGYLNIAIKNLVNLLYTPMLLSFIGQADYGVYQTANSFVFSLTLLTFGFTGAYVRFYTQKKTMGSERDIRVLNGMYLVLYATICVITLVFGFLFSTNAGSFFSGGFTLNQVELAGRLMAIMTVNVAVTIFATVFDAYIIACEQFRFQQTRQMLTTLMTPAIAYVLLEMEFGAVGVALVQLFVAFVLLILNVRFAYCKLGMRFCFKRFDAVLFRSIAAFSSWIFINQACDLVNQSVPNMILGALTTAATVSVFAVAIQVRQVFYSLSTTLSSVFVPKINYIVATSDDNEELTHLMTRVGRYQMLLFCWTYCGFVLLGKFFVSRWAGDSFLESYNLICVMTLPLAVPLCQNTGIEIQRAKNRHKARSVVYLCMSILNVVFTCMASPYLGYWAPAIAYVVGIALGNGLFMNWYYHVRIGLDMRYFWKRNLPIILISFVVLIACEWLVQFMPIASWQTFLFWGFAYTALFMLAMWHLVIGKGERAALASKILSYRHRGQE